VLYENEHYCKSPGTDRKWSFIAITGFAATTASGYHQFALAILLSKTVGQRLRSASSQLFSWRETAFISFLEAYLTLEMLFE
jgi:hypothetical protein